MKAAFQKKIFIAAIGCPRRHLDAARLRDFFTLNDCAIVRNARNADYILFVTCSFKKNKEEECLRRIREFLTCRGELIVAGCLPDISGERLGRIFGGRTVSTRSLEEIEDIFPGFAFKLSDVPDAHSLYGTAYPWRQWLAANLGFGPRTLAGYAAHGRFLVKSMLLGKKAYLRVSRGCSDRCAYCSIHLAVGTLKSRPLDECLRQYRGLLERGYRNFVLLADNLGAYGLDSGSNLEQLLASLADADKGRGARWDIRDLHPRWAVKYRESLSRYVAERKIISLICPIQSGSNRLLGLMNRQHRIEEIKEVLGEFRRLQPGVFLSTQIIAGFPSETEAEFVQTLDAVRAIGFNLAMVYPYHDGRGALSSGMAGKIPESVVLDRVQRAAGCLRRAGVLCAIDESPARKRGTA